MAQWLESLASNHMAYAALSSNPTRDFGFFHITSLRTVCGSTQEPARDWNYARTTLSTVCKTYLKAIIFSYTTIKSTLRNRTEIDISFISPLGLLNNYIKSCLHSSMFLYNKKRRLLIYSSVMNNRNVAVMSEHIERLLSTRNVVNWQMKQRTFKSIWIFMFLEITK